ncbi:14564_t:CDS:2, partial [Funneliformis mosseae]
MLTCSDPTPLAFFPIYIPNTQSSSNCKYRKVLDLAMNKTDNQEVLSKFRRIKGTIDKERILFDWETLMHQKTAILVRRSVHNTNFNIHEEINTFAQNEKPSTKHARIDK